ncbi:hypothetical protein BC828DRAFT_379403 [Blastocladiella britannica]|nr:hypothetical protein BC828DRAFT_379403 [Blastocladiella britannica]
MTVARFRMLDPKQLSWGQWLTGWIIHPHSRRYKVWSTAVLLTIYITVVLEPYAAAFDRTNQFIVVLYAADFFFFCDVLMKFHVPYVEEHILVMDIDKISWNYLETEFWLDIATLVPIECIAPLFSGTVAYWILRTNRLLRVYRCFKFFAHRESDLNASFSIVFVKFIFLISLVSHWFTCMLYIIGCPSLCRPTDDIIRTWPSSALPAVDIRNVSTGSRYLLTLYFSVYTLTSTGYGHIKPRVNAERWALIFGMGCCNFVFGYCIGTVTSLLVNFRGIQLQYQQKVQAVRDYMMQRSFPEDLQSRIMDYYDHLWLRTNGIDAFVLLQQLPPAFNAEVTLRVNESFLNKVQIFHGASKSFLMTLSRALRPEMFLPGDLIIHRGDVGQEMYFICRGKVEIVSENLVEVYEALGEGSFFGEVSIIMNCPRTDNIRAATHCDIRVLAKADLDQILVHFPDMAQRILAKCEDRVRKHQARAREASEVPMTNYSINGQLISPMEGLAKQSALSPLRSVVSLSAPAPAKTTGAGGGGGDMNGVHSSTRSIMTMGRRNGPGSVSAIENGAWQAAASMTASELPSDPSVSATVPNPMVVHIGESAPDPLTALARGAVSVTDTIIHAIPMPAMPAMPAFPMPAFPGFPAANKQSQGSLAARRAAQGTESSLPDPIAAVNQSLMELGRGADGRAVSGSNPHLTSGELSYPQRTTAGSMGRNGSSGARRKSEATSSQLMFGGSARRQTVDPFAPARFQ